jgi:hypothetical protein
VDVGIESPLFVISPYDEVGALAVLAAVIYVPFARDLFHFSSLHSPDLVICVAAGALSVVWFEGVKIFSHRGAAKAAPSPLLP